MTIKKIIFPCLFLYLSQSGAKHILPKIKYKNTNPHPPLIYPIHTPLTYTNDKTSNIPFSSDSTNSLPPSFINIKMYDPNNEFIKPPPQNNNKEKTNKNNNNKDNLNKDQLIRKKQKPIPKNITTKINPTPTFIPLPIHAHSLQHLQLILQQITKYAHRNKINENISIQLYYHDTLAQNKTITPNSYGYLYFAKKLPPNFLSLLQIIANYHNIDPNELLAIIHQESHYAPNAFNVMPYTQPQNYKPIGSGNVGLFQFSKTWISPYDNYLFSMTTREFQLLWFHYKLQYFKFTEPIYNEYLKQKGGTLALLLGPYLCNPTTAQHMLAYHPIYSLYFRYTSYNTNSVLAKTILTMDYDTLTQSFHSYLKPYFLIEQAKYKTFNP